MNRQDSPDAGWLNEAGAELEQLDHDTNQPRPPRPAQDGRRREPEKPPAADPGKPADQSQTDDDVINPGDEAPPPEKPAAQAQAEPERPLKAPELRKAYEETKGRLAERETELTTLRARVTELEQAGPKDTEQTQQRMQAIQARNQQLEEFVRQRYYEQSQEYIDKYQKPYEQRWERCLRDINQLEVEVPDGKGGWTNRKATDADITHLANLATTNLGEYIKQSNAMFGDAADIVRKHVEGINETWFAQSNALEEAKKRATELAKNSETQTLAQRQASQKLWEHNNTDLATKFPAYFAPVQGDTSGNKLLDAGFAFADLLFQTGRLDPERVKLLPEKYRTEIEATGKLSPQSKVRVDAIIRNKAANHDRLARSLKAERAAHEATKKKLSEYEDSEPPAGGSAPRGGGSGGGHWSDDPNAEIDQLDRASR